MISVLGFAAGPRSFAIIVDSRSYEHCAPQLEQYRLSVEADGLRSYICHSDWQNPEQVKDSIALFYRTRALEGVVFVGDIPIPMIFGAQHFASAFKMDEKRSARRDAAIPSDRFYDDFSLKFDFIERDGEEPGFFYYRLRGDCPQEINCDIYSGRIKPSGLWQDKYEELSRYLSKIVRVKKEKNYLDKVVSYTGEGSFSNSIVAWKDETITFREQYPLTSVTPDGERFFIYSMYQYPKDRILKEIARDDLDLVLFHEHGVPQKQYLSGIPEPAGIDDGYRIARYRMHEKIRNLTRRGKMSFDDAVVQLKARYPYLEDDWFVNPEDSVIAREDSLLDARTGIMLKDVWETKPNVRVALFDACYNGDFREPDCIGSRYIFSGGNCVVSLANSVNVLQDKSSTDLLGLMAVGLSVGQSQQCVNIMESHILGDPTFHFARPEGTNLPDFHSCSIGYWKRIFAGRDTPCDIKALALRKLYKLKAPGLSKLLLKAYTGSDEYMLRLQCMHLLAHYDDGNYSLLLKRAADDSYEFIRRKAAYYMSQRCDDDMPAVLAKMYLQDFNARRIVFNIGFYSANFGPDVFPAAITGAVQQAAWLYDGKAVLDKALKEYGRGISMYTMMKDAIADTSLTPGRRVMYINSLRNNPAPSLAPSVLSLIKNPSEDLQLRIDFAEALGWYVRAGNRAEIVKSLQSYLDTEGAVLDFALKAEIVKTINRLKDYLR